MAWLYNDSPVANEVVVNDRWGAGDTCKHGGYYTCADRYNPGHLINHKWENCFTLDLGSWGFRRNANISKYLDIDTILNLVVSTVSCGGNVLINVGPTAGNSTNFCNFIVTKWINLEGTIVPIMQERLLALGSWLAINGDAIYSTRPWRVQNDTADCIIWYTSKGSTVYAISFVWPSNNKLVLTQVKVSFPFLDLN